MIEHDNIEDKRDEIKKEFQLERMILFSDAVFAIVITLMAIEIKIPELEGSSKIHNLSHSLWELLPVFLAYIVSFFFIGSTWYHHLKIFSLLKDYDRGLVIRNLVLLFFIGLFPFSVSVITRARETMVALFVYMSIVLLCLAAQFVLHDYILQRRPQLRLNTDLSASLAEFRRRRSALILFVSTFILIAVTALLIQPPALKYLATLWMVPFAIINNVIHRNHVKGKRRSSGR